MSTCIVCGKETSMTTSASVLGVWRPACAICYMRDDIEEKARVPFKDATADELRAALDGTPSTSWRELVCVREEMARRANGPS